MMNRVATLSCHPVLVLILLDTGRGTNIFIWSCGRHWGNLRALSYAKQYARHVIGYSEFEICRPKRVKLLKAAFGHKSALCGLVTLFSGPQLLHGRMRCMPHNFKMFLAKQ